MPSPSYLKGLQEAILAVHGAEARHISTSRVKDVFEGAVAFDGEVETFELLNHPKAKRCFAWAYTEDGTMHTTAVLELPPVDSPGMAVTIAIAAEGRQEKH